jgi:hypothetical protein
VNTTLSPAAAYVDAVRAALADLPADDLAEIVEDVRDHLDQVAAELADGASAAALEERLGTPADYAAELRSAAGYPAAAGLEPTNRIGRRPVRWLVSWSLRIAAVLTALALVETFFVGRFGPISNLAVLAWIGAGLLLLLYWAAASGIRGRRGVILELPDANWLYSRRAGVAEHPVGAAILETVSGLRPAWWLLRAWVAVELIGMFVSMPWFPLPRFPGAPLLFVAAIVASVWLGRRATQHRQTSPETALVLVGNVVATLGLLWVVAGLSQVNEEIYPGEASIIVPEGAIRGGAVREDGTDITNLYPYGPDGRLLENVRLYDQDGRPFSSLLYDGCLFDEMIGESDLPALNVFPRPSSSYGEDGVEPVCRDLGIVPPLGSTLPGSPSDTTAAPEPTPTPTPTPRQ